MPPEWGKAMLVSCLGLPSQNPGCPIYWKQGSLSWRGWGTRYLLRNTTVMEVRKGSAGTGENSNGSEDLFWRPWESYSGADSLTPSLRAVRAERKEERETRGDTFTG